MEVEYHNILNYWRYVQTHDWPSQFVCTMHQHFKNHSQICSINIEYPFTKIKRTFEWGKGKTMLSLKPNTPNPLQVFCHQDIAKFQEKLSNHRIRVFKTKYIVWNSRNQKQWRSNSYNQMCCITLLRIFCRIWVPADSPWKFNTSI